jgi:hypothetical protein
MVLHDRGIMNFALIAVPQGLNDPAYVGVAEWVFVASCYGNSRGNAQ